MMDSRYKNRLKIITLSENTSKSQDEIASCVGVSKSCVSKVLKEYAESGSFELKYDNCGGTNKKLDNRDIRRLRIISGNNPRMTAREVQAEMGPRGEAVCLRTIQRGLLEAGCIPRVPKKRPMLSSSAVKKRYDWAVAHRHWTIEDWKQVVWSDETAIEMLDYTPRFVRFVDGFPETRDHVVNTTKHPAKVIIWSCFSYTGPGRSHVVECSMNTDWYVNDIIDGRVIPQLREWFPSGTGILQQDNAPCHVSKRAKEHMMSKGITLLDWPPSSPDINPIENLWAIVKNKVMKQGPRSKKELIHKFLQVWHHDEHLAEVMQNLVSSMPKRVQCLLQSQGHHTKY